MPNPSIKDEQMYEELRSEGNSKEKSARIANAAAVTNRVAPALDALVLVFHGIAFRLPFARALPFRAPPDSAENDTSNRAQSRDQPDQEISHRLSPRVRRRRRGRR